MKRMIILAVLVMMVMPGAARAYNVGKVLNYGLVGDDYRGVSLSGIAEIIRAGSSGYATVKDAQTRQEVARQALGLSVVAEKQYQAPSQIQANQRLLLENQQLREKINNLELENRELQEKINNLELEKQKLQKEIENFELQLKKTKLQQQLKKAKNNETTSAQPANQ